jgi:hypothetical protein
LDLEAEVDAMLIHLETAPARKPKSVARRNKRPLAAEVERMEPDPIIPSPPDREPTLEITDADTLVEPGVALHVTAEIPTPPPKRRGRQTKGPPAPPPPPPDPFELGIVALEDDEELYFLHEDLRRRKAGIPEWGAGFCDPADGPPKRHPAVHDNATALLALKDTARSLKP